MSSHNKLRMQEAVVILTRINIIKCNYCPKAFTKTADYKLHKIRHKLLDMQRKRKEKNRLFYKSNIPGFKKNLQCDECDMKFVERSTLKAHSALHKPFPHICVCGVGFYIKEDLKCHIKLVHTDEETKKT